ncbi:MAG: hypothetical protein JSS07_02970 [Proteobacteria bacterium]|nr:hypothetical protein [Pseudomonadota bacterium]
MIRKHYGCRLILLLNLSLQSIVMVTRSPENAVKFANHPSLRVYDYHRFKEAQEQPFDLVINTTTLSLQAILPPIDPKWLNGAITLDFAYTRQKTIFQEWALQQGASETHDGIGMLVCKRRIAFSAGMKYFLIQRQLFVN